MPEHKITLQTTFQFHDLWNWAKIMSNSTADGAILDISMQYKSFCSWMLKVTNQSSVNFFNYWSQYRQGWALPFSSAHLELQNKLQ